MYKNKAPPKFKKPKIIHYFKERKIILRNKFVTVKFNITKLVYTLVFNENGNYIEKQETTIFLRKQREKFIENRLNEIVNEHQAIGYKDVVVTTEEKVSEIPLDVCLEYQTECQN